MSITRMSNIFDPFSLDLWVHSMASLSTRVFSPSLSFPSDTSAFATARIDWKETPEAHVFKADLPGIKKEEIKVEVEESNVLQISGERARENEKTDTCHRVERSSGNFFRCFRLPENAKMDQIKAAMENGVLIVTVPKERSRLKKPQVKSIEFSG